MIRLFKSLVERCTRTDIRLYLSDGWQHQCPKPATYRNEILGTITPPNRPVQVWILAGDKLWYLQPRMKYTDVKDGNFVGSAFAVNGFFGNPDSPQGNPYKVVAVCPTEDLASPSPRLPAGVQSNIIDAFRQDAA